MSPFSLMKHIFSIVQDKSGLGLDDTIHETILSLRLLGKFLGFIEFMPFVFSDHESKGWVFSSEKMCNIANFYGSPKIRIMFVCV